MTYGEVKTHFLGLFNRTDLTARPALAVTFLQQAILRIQRDLRVPMMEKTVIATIGDTYNGLIIPGDLLELKALLVDSDADGVFDDQLETEQLQRVLALSQGSGVPRKYSRQGAKWYLGPRPNEGDRIRIDYYATFTALSADEDENILTKAAWDLLVNAACVCASTWFKDARKDLFEQDYRTILNGLQEQADTDELGGGSVVAPAYSFPEEL